MKHFRNNLRATAASVTVVFFVSVDNGTVYRYLSHASQAHTWAQSETYLNLAIRITNDDVVEVLRARVISGNLIRPNTPPSEYVYEVIRDKKIILVGFLSQDAFIRRTLANSKTQESLEKANSATIVINVPAFESSAKCNLEIRMYRIKSGEEVQEITPSVMQRLKIQRRLCPKLKIPARKVCAAIARDNVRK